MSDEFDYESALQRMAPLPPKTCRTSVPTPPSLAKEFFSGRYRTACVRAIETAAAKLGIDPATLAERCKDGEIATLVEAADESVPALRMFYEQVSGEHRPDQSLPRVAKLNAALEPFRKE